MRKVLRGYAKGQDGNLIQIGTIPVPYSKDKRSPRERHRPDLLLEQNVTPLRGAWPSCQWKPNYCWCDKKFAPHNSSLPR
jgi:hypothetical protein